MNVLPAHLSRMSELMNAAEFRHRTISQNLANVNTPGYQRMDVDFEEMLSRKLLGRNDSNSTAMTPKLVQTAGLSVRGDGNNVDIDVELSELNRNTLLFQTCSQFLSSQFDMMRRAIR